MSSVLPLDTRNILYVVSDIPPSITSRFVTDITNSSPSGIKSGIPSSMLNRFPLDDHKVVHNNLYHNHVYIKPTNNELLNVKKITINSL